LGTGQLLAENGKRPFGRATPARGSKRDEIWVNRHRALVFYLSMIFSENRFTLFRIML
jgi:hypothetical protein